MLVYLVFVRNNQILETVPITYQSSSTILQRRFAHRLRTQDVEEMPTDLVAKNSVKDSADLSGDKMYAICRKMLVHVEVILSNTITTRTLDVVANLRSEAVEETETDSVLMRIVRLFV